jgi:drug/metabolite transporter (DMT)-like permease
VVSGAYEERDSKKVSRKGLANLFVVYVVWSSTYLAIRVAVRTGSGFPPFTVGATRLLAAGVILFAIAVATRQKLKLSRDQFLVLAATGLLLWVGGNGMVNWAEQEAPSGFTALMLASVPIWVAAIQAGLKKQRPSPVFLGSLACGFAGVAVLTAPSLLSGASIRLTDSLVLLFAAASWALGSVLQTRLKPGIPPLVSSAYQQLFGAMGMGVMVLISREPPAAPGVEALWAWGYLVVFGSVLAFTSYVTALRLLPTRIAMTYAYVNPILAVVLGSLLLQEQITPWTPLGGLLIVAGVAGVYRSRHD